MDALQVDVGALQRLSKELVGIAQHIDALDPTNHISAATDAVVGSDVARVSGSAAERVIAAYRNIGNRISRMSTAAEVNARDYDRAEHEFTELLKDYGRVI